MENMSSHLEYFKKYQIGVAQYGELLVALAFKGKKLVGRQLGYDVEATLEGRSSKIEVKSKLSNPPSFKATVINCKDTQFKSKVLDYLAVVLVNNETYEVSEAYLLDCETAAKLPDKKTKYIAVKSVRKCEKKQNITELLNNASKMAV